VAVVFGDETIRHILGAIQALNGWLLFGFTTAFLFALIERVWALCSHQMPTVGKELLVEDVWSHIPGFGASRMHEDNAKPKTQGRLL